MRLRYLGAKEYVFSYKASVFYYAIWWIASPFQHKWEKKEAKNWFKLQNWQWGTILLFVYDHVEKDLNCTFNSIILTTKSHESLVDIVTKFLWIETKFNCAPFKEIYTHTHTLFKCKNWISLCELIPFLCFARWVYVTIKWQSKWWYSSRAHTDYIARQIHLYGFRSWAETTWRENFICFFFILFHFRLLFILIVNATFVITSKAVSVAISPFALFKSPIYSTFNVTWRFAGAIVRYDAKPVIWCMLSSSKPILLHGCAHNEMETKYEPTLYTPLYC